MAAKKKFTANWLITGHAEKPEIKLGETVQLDPEHEHTVALVDSGALSPADKKTEKDSD